MFTLKKMLGKSTFLCLWYFAVAFAENESRVIKTSQGQIRGYRDPEGGLYTFYSIPYATAPTGRRKFMAPLPPPMWLDTFDAVDKRIICPQVNMGLNGVMQEDCLILNVYVPETEEKKVPTIVYIHGGAFQSGFGNILTPKQLAKTKKVIVVTFNYRLGAHGFLCLGTEAAPGNAGLKDQVAALRWVNRNIINFGGNPDDVTITGYSAGATSVDLLAISNSATGLFHKVIIESGSNLMAGGVVTDPLENARIFAASLGFTDLDDVYALEHFYKSASFDSLTKGTVMDRTNSTLLFAPCIDQEFLVDTPLNILKNGKYRRVPMLYGFSNMEGLFRAPYFDVWKQKMNEKFSDFLPGDLEFENDKQKEEVAKEVKKKYFGYEPVSDGNILNYIDYFSDVLFKYPVLRTVRMHLENGHDKIYLYEYSYVDEDFPVAHTHVRGANHCGQTYAVLDSTDKTENNISEEYKTLKNYVRDFWTNFAKTGTPVPVVSELPPWPPATAQRSPHMELALPPQLRGELLPHRARFWDDLYDKHYRPPVPPPAPPTTHTEL